MNAARQDARISSSVRRWWEEALHELQRYGTWQFLFIGSAACLVVMLLSFWHLAPNHVLGGWLLLTLGFSYLQQLWLEHPDSPLYPATSLNRTWILQWIVLLALQGGAWGLGALLLVFHADSSPSVMAPEWLDLFIALGLLALALPTALWLSPLFPADLVYLMCALLLPALALHLHGPGSVLSFLVLMSGVILLGYSAVRSFYLLASATQVQDDSLDQARRREEEAMREKQAAEEETQNVAALLYQDALTGIANRRHFDDFLDREWRRCRRNAALLSLVMIDIDFFKSYNDHFGHPAGDRCLRQVASVLSAFPRRPGDLVARYGGEEFAVILAETDASSAMTIAERMRQAVAAERIDHPHSRASDTVTISMGVATLSPDQKSDMRTLVLQADQALYQAKGAGRNRAVQYTDPEEHDLERYLRTSGSPVRTEEEEPGPA